MYNGTVYTIFCSELDLPEDKWTKLGSYQAANEWWVAKRAEIDSSPAHVFPPDTEEAIHTLKRKLDYSEQNSLDVDAATYASALANAKQQAKRGEYDLPDLDPKTAARLRLAEDMGFTLPSGMDPTALDVLFGSDSLWEDRLRRDKPIALSKMIGTHLDAWYPLVHRRAKPTSITNIHGYYQEFKNIRSGGALVLSEHMDVSVLDETKFRAVYDAFASQPLAEGTKKKKWSYFKQFVNYLYEAGLITLPKNFRSKLLVFSPKTTSKAAPNVAAIRSFLDTLPDRLKLYALLALNCGMNNVDIGKLRHDQIDWKKRTLTRKRIKTEDQPNVPTVTYALWSETCDLLRELQNTSGDYVLTTSDGERLYLDEKTGDKSSVYDRIKTQWRDYFKGKQTKAKFTLKQFRFFGADLLNTNTDYDNYRDSFLGHAPRSSGDKSYSSGVNVSVACEYLESLFRPAAQSRNKNPRTAKR